MCMCKCVWMHVCYVVHVEVKRQLGELILSFTTCVSGTEPKLSALVACMPPFFFKGLTIYSPAVCNSICLWVCLRTDLSLWPIIQFRLRWNLQLAIFLPETPKCWDYRCEAPHYLVLRVQLWDIDTYYVSTLTILAISLPKFIFKRKKCAFVLHMCGGQRQLLQSALSFHLVEAVPL